MGWNHQPVIIHLQVLGAHPPSTPAPRVFACFFPHGIHTFQTMGPQWDPSGDKMLYVYLRMNTH